MNARIELEFQASAECAPELTQTKFQAQDRSKDGGVVRATMLANRQPGGNDSHRFGWTPGVKGLALLFLRSEAHRLRGQPDLFKLNAPKAKVAHAFLEAVRRSDAWKKNRWLPRMFGAENEDDQQCHAAYFDHDYQAGWVSLDRSQWTQGSVTIRCDGAPVNSHTKLDSLADCIEQDTPWLPLALTAQVLVAPPGRSGLADFRPVAPGTVPVRAGQRLRIHVTVNREAYLYVCWIGPAGPAEAAFPWAPGPGFERFPKAETPRKDLELPLPGADGQLKSWGFENTPGLETLVALARETPLTSEERLALQEGLQGFASLPGGGSTALGPFPFEIRPPEGPGLRIDYLEQPVADPVAQRHAELCRRLGPHADAGGGVSFLNAG